MGNFQILKISVLYLTQMCWKPTLTGDNSYSLKPLSGRMALEDACDPRQIRQCLQYYQTSENGLQMADSAWWPIGRVSRLCNLKWSSPLCWTRCQVSLLLGRARWCTKHIGQGYSIASRSGMADCMFFLIFIFNGHVLFPVTSVQSSAKDHVM